jgi:site-specific recombinase XerD
MSNLRRRFIRDLKIRNYSDRTITSYVNALIGLSKFYSRCPSTITTPEIKDYLKYLTDQGKSWSTINLVLSACNLLYQETLQQPEKIQSIGRPKFPKMLPVVFSEEEVEHLLSQVKNIKHKAILMTISWN